MNGDDNNDKPLTARSAHPLAVAALGRGAARSRPRLDRGIAMRTMCLLAIVAILLEPHQWTGGWWKQQQGSVLSPVAPLPRHNRNGFAIISKKQLPFRSNKSPKEGAKTAAVALQEEPETKEEPPIDPGPEERLPSTDVLRITPGWQDVFVETPKEMTLFSWKVTRFCFGAVLRKVKPIPMDLAFPHMI